MPRYSSHEYYVTSQSDMFDIIAYDLYGNEFLASDIAELNPEYCGELVFDAGIELKVPVYDEPSDSERVAPWRRPA